MRVGGLGLVLALALDLQVVDVVGWRVWLRMRRTLRCGRGRV